MHLTHAEAYQIREALDCIFFVFDRGLVLLH